MITIAQISFETMHEQTKAAHIVVPIEQTSVWATFQAHIDGRTPAGVYAVLLDDRPIAWLALVDMHTHHYHYVRAEHAPVWAEKPTEKLEREVICALSAFMRKYHPSYVFMRLNTWYEADTHPVLSTTQYDQTVIIDLTGGDEAILSRMKSRGRRDVRKALRECPANYTDETEQAAVDFSEYYEVIVETAKRDGFTPAPISDYTNMISSLGKAHCRVFAARIDGRVAAWSIVTRQETVAVRYYAAMRSEFMRMHVTDALLYKECCMLGAAGVTDYDLMGIGSEFSPSLMGLNEFKTKFTKDTTSVSPGRDVALRKYFYWSLSTLQALRTYLRERKSRRADTRRNT